MYLQYASSEYSKNLKAAESALNDQRLKLVSDLVVGCRVIKCYGWELHYIEKIKAIREKQVAYVIRLNLVSSLGNSIFSNMGLLAVFVILYSEWNKGKLLSNETAVTVLAMVYFVFFAINTILYMGLTNVFNFLAILERMSTVMGL